MGVESILKSVSDSAGKDDSGDLRRPHTDDAVPTSAAAIPHQSLTHATLKAPWLTSFVWMSVAAGAGMLGAAAAAAAAWPVALVAAAVAGVASARVILKRRRQITVRGDRLVEDTGWGSRELRLSEVRLIQQGRRFIQKARDPLSAASLSFKSDDASISFADLKPEGAHEVATAVLQIVAPRLLEQCPRRQGTTRDDKGRQGTTRDDKGRQGTTRDDSFVPAKSTLVKPARIWLMFPLCLDDVAPARLAGRRGRCGLLTLTTPGRAHPESSTGQRISPRR